MMQYFLAAVYSDKSSLSEANAWSSFSAAGAPRSVDQLTIWLGGCALVHLAVMSVTRHVFSKGAQHMPQAWPAPAIKLLVADEGTSLDGANDVSCSDFTNLFSSWCKLGFLSEQGRRVIDLATS